MDFRKETDVIVRRCEFLLRRVCEPVERGYHWAYKGCWPNKRALLDC
jgi:hypothetical protein